ncbi:hypothetical protein [Amycolatopsis sp. cmx-11-12]|uniref:hypothetical protein n=1 Tax=Amycolatopsis sp. cmx-11-12 TaxID=2785795 RepID=UPI003917C4F2
MKIVQVGQALTGLVGRSVSMKFFSLAALVAVTTVGSALTAEPASAVQECPAGWACLQLGTSGSGPVLRFNDENWRTLDNSAGTTGATLINNQGEGDDACVATGLAGTGQVFCVPPRQVVTVKDFIVRSVRG